MTSGGRDALHATAPLSTTRRAGVSSEGARSCDRCRAISTALSRTSCPRPGRNLDRDSWRRCAKRSTTARTRSWTPSNRYKGRVTTGDTAVPTVVDEEFLEFVMLPELRADPYPFYHRLRAFEPVHKCRSRSGSCRRTSTSRRSCGMGASRATEQCGAPSDQRVRPPTALSTACSRRCSLP